jgi:hypothetical protein
MEFCVFHLAEIVHTQKQVHRCAATHSKDNAIMIMTKVTVSWSDYLKL